MDEAADPHRLSTAAYGLHHLARIKPGSAFLIHAAAGGVDLAARQVRAAPVPRSRHRGQPATRLPREFEFGT